MRGTLTDDDHDAMDAFLVATFEAVRAGRFTRDAFVEHMAYALTALDIGNRAEARWYFEAGAAAVQSAGWDAPASRPVGHPHIRLVAQAAHHG